MLLFKRGRLGTSRIGCGGKISGKPCLFTFSSGKYYTYYRVYDNWWLIVWHIYLFWYVFKISMKWLCSSSLCIIDFCKKTDAEDKIRNYWLSRNTKGHQENRPKGCREYLLNKTEINRDKGGIGQKGLPLDWEPAIATGSFIFLQIKKNRENFLKQWTNPAPLNKSLKIIGKKLIISTSNKIKTSTSNRTGSLKNLRDI